MLRRRAGRSSSLAGARVASLLLLALAMSTSGVQYNSLLFSSDSDCDFEDASYGNSSTTEGDWWAENYTSNFTELCRGIMDFNSSEPINSSYPEGNYTYTPCGHEFYTYNYTMCNNRNIVTLTTPTLSYVHAQSNIVATVDPNATEGWSKLYYKLCYRRMDMVDDESKLIDCFSNGTEMRSKFTWQESGEAVLMVHVYTSPNYSDSAAYMGCGYTKVTVANNSNLELQVELDNDPIFPDEDTQPYVGGASQCDALRDRDREDDEIEKIPMITGNITFQTFTNLTAFVTSAEDVEYFYKYVIRGPLNDERVATCSRQSNWTDEYLEKGDYHYGVHVIAYLNQVEAYHAYVSGKFEVLEGVKNAMIVVGNNDTIRVGTHEVTIAAEGSTPIEVCWVERKIPDKKSSNGGKNGSPSPPHPPPKDDGDPPPPPPPPPHPLRDPTYLFGRRSPECITLQNSTFIVENRYFNIVGTFEYQAHFCNKASQISKNFPYTVRSGTSPAVVASSATAVVVIAVLIALSVIIVALIIGGYIPYRRYKNRMTETADFRFVDLSETGSRWDHVKHKANQFMDYFRRRRRNEKIGLVNLGSVPSSEERKLFYGTNTRTQFAPYETL